MTADTATRPVDPELDLVAVCVIRVAAIECADVQDAVPNSIGPRSPYVSR